MNGDGNADIVVLLRWSNQVAIILNTAPVTYGIGSGAGGPEVLDIGDFDNDGDLDIATANFAGAGNMSVLLNNGNGTFAGAVVYGTSGPTWIAAADFNADGYLDLIVVNTFSNALTVFQNNGNGTFTSAGTIATGAGTNPRKVYVADVDNDGDIDVLTQLSLSGQISVFRNNGLGVFGSQANFSAAATEAELITGDINGDGYIDVVTTPFTAGTNVEVRFNNGDGTFALPTLYPTATTTLIGVRLADVNGDGSLDLLTNDGNTSDDMFVRLNNGTGSFGAATRYSSYNTLSDLADIDGDGDLDMLSFRFGENGIKIIKNGIQPVLTTLAPTRHTNTAAVNAATSLTFTQTMTTGTASVNAFKVWGGFTGLKTAGTYSGGGTATPSLQPSAATQFRPGEQVWVTVTNAQTNLAGSVGIAARPQVYGFRTQAGPGPATLFQTANSGAVIGLYNTGGDITGDGNLDIVQSQDILRVFAGDGAGNFAAPTTHGTNNLNRRKPAVGDFNNDGRLDVASGIFGGGVQIFLNTGTGLPALPNSTILGFPHGFSVCVADFNGDGNQDVAAGDVSGTTIRIAFGNGTGAFPVLGTAVSVGSMAPGALWSGDLDGDGDLDLLVSRTGGLSIMQNDGAGGMTLWQTFALPVAQGDVADIDGNGTLDVVVALNGDVYVFRNTTGTGILTPDPSLVAGESVDVVTFADMDGMNGPDIVAGD